MQKKGATKKDRQYSDVLHIGGDGDAHYVDRELQAGWKGGSFHTYADLLRRYTRQRAYNVESPPLLSGFSVSRDVIVRPPPRLCVTFSLDANASKTNASRSIPMA